MPTKTKPSVKPQRLITLIHVAKSKLGMDDDTYRDMLLSTTGKTSSKDCTISELEAMLDRLKKAGFALTTKKHHKPNAADSKQKLINKIEALLADSQRPWAYAHRMAAHMYKVDQVHWCNTRQLLGIVAALEVDKNRKKSNLDNSHE